jgi:hypothetical protein
MSTEGVMSKSMIWTNVCELVIRLWFRELFKLSVLNLWPCPSELHRNLQIHMYVSLSSQIHRNKQKWNYPSHIHTNTQNKSCVHVHQGSPNHETGIVSIALIRLPHHCFFDVESELKKRDR